MKKKVLILLILGGLTFLSGKPETGGLVSAQGTVIHDIVTDEGDGNADASYILLGENTANQNFMSMWEFIPKASGYVDQIQFNMADAYPSVVGDVPDFTVNIRIKEESVVNAGYTTGTIVATWNPKSDWSTGWKTISISNYLIQQGSPYTLKFQTVGSDNDGKAEYMKLYEDTSSTSPIHSKTNLQTNPGGYGQIKIRIVPPTPTLTPTPTPTPTPTATPTPTPTPPPGAPTPTPTPTPPAAPATKPMVADSSGSGGGVVSAATILNPTAAAARSQRLWVATPYGGVDFPDYEELKDIYDFDNATTINQLSQISSPGRYKINGDYTINPPTAPCKQLGVAAVIFINGSLTIRKEFSDVLNNPSTSELLAARQNCQTAAGQTTSPVFIVRDDINIDGSVNNIYGVFYAGGTINTGSSSNRLYVFGSLLANGFSFGRDLAGGNATYPAEEIIFMPKYFLDLGSENIFGQTRITWKEVR